MTSTLRKLQITRNADIKLKQASDQLEMKRAIHKCVGFKVNFG
jgi:hypothetical protein